MARSYTGRSKNATMLTITGFENYISLLDKVEKQGIDSAVSKAFNDMTNELSSTLREKCQDAELPQHLIDGISEYKVDGKSNRYFYNIGWRRKDKDTFMKVCWLNYGTPHRSTLSGAYRGKIEPRYFITNTKRAVKQKFNARMKKLQQEMLGDLKK